MYTLYGITIWGQAAQGDLNTILTGTKTYTLSNFFFQQKISAIPLFIALNILSVNIPYFERVSAIMHDISTNSMPRNIRQL